MNLQKKALGHVFHVLLGCVLAVLKSLGSIYTCWKGYSCSSCVRGLSPE